MSPDLSHELPSEYARSQGAIATLPPWSRSNLALCQGSHVLSNAMPAQVHLRIGWLHASTGENAAAGSTSDRHVISAR
eukprot:4114337-Alexandrium_andersonii.AAC.2